MRSYTITIAPDEPTQATTTIRVEVIGTAVRIAELRIRAGEGDGLTATQTPAIDLPRLVQAVIAATPVDAASDTVTPAAKPVTDETGLSLAMAPASAARSTHEQTVSPRMIEPADQTPTSVPSHGAQISPTREGAGTEAMNKRGAASTTKAAKTTKPKRASKGISVPATGRERTYRRAPEDLEDVYRQAGTATAVADHYDVPQHTAYAWIRTLRRVSARVAS